MEPGPIFLRLRTIAFSCIFSISFLWVIVLCVELYIRWDVSDEWQRNLVVVLVLTNGITDVMLPALLIVRFRAWLDAARILFLVLIHTGTAIVYTIWNPHFQCPKDTPDSEGVCRLLDMYILMGTWVVPALLFAYAACLGAAVYRQWKHPSFNNNKAKEFEFDEEKATSSPPRHPSVLPIMSPPRISLPPPTATDSRHQSYHFSAYFRSSSGDMSNRMSLPSSRHMSLPASRRSMAPSSTKTTPISERQRKQRSLVPSIVEPLPPRSSGRLSKPLPQSYFE